MCQDQQGNRYDAAAEKGLILFAQGGAFSTDLAPPSAYDPYPAPALPFPFERNFQIPLAHESRELLSPLDQQNALRRHEIVKGQRIKFALRVDTVEIDVVERDRRAAIFVDERKRRAGDVICLCRLKAFGNAFDHGGLPCSQVAAQQHDGTGLKFSGKPPAKIDSFFRRMGLERLHRWR